MLGWFFRTLSRPTHHVQDVFLCFLGARQLHSTRHVLQRQRQESLQGADETERDITRSAAPTCITLRTLTLFTALSAKWTPQYLAASYAFTELSLL